MSFLDKIAGSPRKHDDPPTEGDAQTPPPPVNPMEETMRLGPGSVLPDSVLDERLYRLQALIAEQQRAAQSAMVGREVEVLFEKPGRMAGQMMGKSEHLHAVNVTAGGLAAGDLRRVRITESRTNSLAGVLV